MLDFRSASLYFMDKFQFIFSSLPILIKKKTNSKINSVQIAPNDDFVSYIIEVDFNNKRKSILKSLNCRILKPCVI